MSISVAMGAPEDFTIKLLIFHSSGLGWAFPVEAVGEIVPMAQLSSPPGMPTGLAGFLDLRGTAIPILRLDRLFDLAEQHPGLYTPLIVLRKTINPIGILVESVRGIATVRSSELLKIPDGRLFEDCATAALRLDGDLIYLLSPDSLLKANEVRLLADFAAASEARLLHFGDGN